MIQYPRVEFIQIFGELLQITDFVIIKEFQSGRPEVEDGQMLSIERFI
jgi:hypothetical protein